MANVPLKSIKFPGLDDTYTVPVVDSSLTQSGAAADAKVAGDKVGELKSAVGVLNELHTDDKNSIVGAINEVNDRFPNGIAAAVSDWLDEHPEATTTVDFDVVDKVFDTVAAMIADDTLKDGNNVRTNGYYTLNDNGGALYKI